MTRGQQPKPFTFKTLGAFADLGRHRAVANLMGFRVKGFLAWAICRFYHLAWMPGLDRKSRLIADWSVEILFPRDLAEMGQLGSASGLELADPTRWTTIRALRFCPGGRCARGRLRGDPSRSA